jgi:hypothetical protein
MNVSTHVTLVSILMPNLVPDVSTHMPSKELNVLKIAESVTILKITTVTNVTPLVELVTDQKPVNVWIVTIPCT